MRQSRAFHSLDKIQWSIVIISAISGPFNTTTGKCSDPVRLRVRPLRNPVGTSRDPLRSHVGLAHRPTVRRTSRSAPSRPPDVPRPSSRSRFWRLHRPSASTKLGVDDARTRRTADPPFWGISNPLTRRKIDFLPRVGQLWHARDRRGGSPEPVPKLSLQVTDNTGVIWRRQLG